jgi:hypothetical protein
MFDFSKVESPEGKYLRPGMYRLSVIDAQFEHPSDKNPRLNVTLANKDGEVVKERFILTPKAFGRLQYLHEQLFGKKLEKAFSSESQIAEYFKKALLGKKVEKTFLVGGEISNDGKIYARLPYSGFILEQEDIEEGPFEPGSARYKEVVKESTLRPNSAAAATDSAILPESSLHTAGETEAMPWDE